MRRVFGWLVVSVFGLVAVISVLGVGFLLLNGDKTEPEQVVQQKRTITSPVPRANVALEPEPKDCNERFQHFEEGKIYKVTRRHKTSDGKNLNRVKFFTIQYGEMRESNKPDFINSYRDDFMSRILEFDKFKKESTKNGLVKKTFSDCEFDTYRTKFYNQFYTFSLDHKMVIFSESTREKEYIRSSETLSIKAVE